MFKHTAVSFHPPSLNAFLSTLFKAVIVKYEGQEFKEHEVEGAVKRKEQRGGEERSCLTSKKGRGSQEGWEYEG